MVTPALAAISVAAVAVQFAIAITAEGGMAAFFSHSALTMLAVSSAVATAVAVTSSGNLSTGVREDRSNRWVLAVFGLLGLLITILPAFQDRMDIGTLDGEAIR